MLINFSVKGYKTFNEKVNFTFKANKKIENKDFVFKYNDDEILKSAIIYGPNNTVKSSFIEALTLLKKIVKDGKLSNDYSVPFSYNFFNSIPLIDYEIEFIQNSNYYKYCLSFEKDKGIINESLFVNNKEVFDRNKTNNDDNMQSAINLISPYSDKLIISTLPNKDYTSDINGFFDNIYILKEGSFNSTINDICDLKSNEFKKFNKIISSADISISQLKIDNRFNNDDSNLLRLFSEYTMNDIHASLPSVITDSSGTKIYMYYIANILKAIRNGGLIVIDEIDKSLHTLLTKSIISLFNDENNKNIQLLATSHDLLLLDCLYLFRKDQIWFTYKDEKEVFLYSLDTFKSNIDKQIRTKTMESYLKGLFGALPHPNLEGIFDE